MIAQDHQVMMSPWCLWEIITETLGIGFTWWIDFQSTFRAKLFLKGTSTLKSHHVMVAYMCAKDSWFLSQPYMGLNCLLLLLCYNFNPWRMCYKKMIGTFYAGLDFSHHSDLLFSYLELVNGDDVGNISCKQRNSLLCLQNHHYCQWLGAWAQLFGWRAFIVLAEQTPTPSLGSVGVFTATFQTPYCFSLLLECALVRSRDSVFHSYLQGLTLGSADVTDWMRHISTPSLAWCEEQELWHQVLYSLKTMFFPFLKWGCYLPHCLSLYST